MEFIKKLWPISFKVKKGSYTSFFVCFFIYVVLCFAVELLWRVTDSVEVLGTVTYVIHWAVDVYGVLGVVFCVFRLFGVKNFDSDEE